MSVSGTHVPQTDWEQLPADPDFERDLGYELMEFDVVRARKNGTGHLMFLPQEEELLKEDAFIVADADSVCDVESRI